MRYRRNEIVKQGETENGDRSAHNGQLLSARPRIHKRNKLFTTMFMLMAPPVALYLIFTYKHQGRMNLRVFFSCRQMMHDAPSSTSSSPCVYFRPTHYFSESQPGHVYKHIMDDTLYDFQWTMWSKQVSTFYSAHERMGPSPPHQTLQHQGVESVSAVLVPKVASRSMEALFQQALSVTLEDRMVLKVKAPRVGTATPAFWKHLAKRQAKANDGYFAANDSKDICIALVRDPVSRFLSSLAQTLSTTMMNKHQPCLDFWTECLGSSTTGSYKDLIQCAIQRMKQTPHFDVHVLPQAVFLVNTLGGQNVEVAVFPLESLPTILQAFGVGGEEQHVNAREKKEYSRDVQERFGNELQHASLAREALDEGMIRDICELYKMDVEMMHDLGFSAGECDNMSR